MSNKQYVQKIEVNGKEYEFSFRPAACRKYRQLTGKDILDWVFTFKDVFFSLIKVYMAADGDESAYEFDDAIYSLIKPGYEEYAKIIYSFMEDANPEIGTYDEWFDNLEELQVFDFILTLYPHIVKSMLSKKDIESLVKSLLTEMEGIEENLATD